MTPQERYEDLVDEFAGVDGVTPPTGGSGFGRGALRYRRKIFAMFVRGQLVVKLPRPRVDELVAGGHGERFDANKGTPMREWFSLDPGSGLPWLPLAREALSFAAAQDITALLELSGDNAPRTGHADAARARTARRRRGPGLRRPRRA